MNKNLLIYGAGGLGRELAELVRTINLATPTWNLVGFIDDAPDIGSVVGGISVIGGEDFFDGAKGDLCLAFGFASTSTKHRLYEKLKHKVSFPTLIHPSAIVSSNAKIGEGCVIAAMCLINVDVVMGKCVFMNVGSQIGHDSVIGDFCSIMPNSNISGNVKIGERTMIGVNANIHQGLSIGADCSVGMGSVVISNLKDNSHVFGNPARKAPI